MSIERFFVTPITIIEPGIATDRYDDDVADFDNPTSETETVGWFAQLTTVEQIGGRDVTITVDKLFLPVGTSISSAAHVVGNGSTYAVDGAPHRARTPEGEHHVEVTLRVVEEVAN